MVLGVGVGGGGRREAATGCRLFQSPKKGRSVARATDAVTSRIHLVVNIPLRSVVTTCTTMFDAKETTNFYTPATHDADFTK